MKRIILLIIVVIIIGSTFFYKEDNLNSSIIRTSSYPVEFITETLYGEESEVLSIYPDETDILSYKLTEKQVEDNSDCGIFIFNGLLDKEKEYVIDMMNQNDQMKIIDSSLSMKYNYSVEELWLNPSNFLMLTQNIKNGLNEYVTSTIIKEKINENYEELKLKISEIDAMLELMGDASESKVIVVSNDLFKYLEKYGIEVISLEENNNLTNKVVNDVKSLISSGTIEYIYIASSEETNETINSIIKDTNVKTLTLKTLSTLSEKDRTNEEDYISIMYDNINALKEELYD